MLLNIELVVKDRFDRLVFADDERVAPRQTNEGPEDIVRFGDAFVRVGDEWKGHVQRAGKPTLRVELIRTDSDEVGTGEEQLVEVIRESLRFAGAVRGEGFGKKVDDRAQSGLFGQHELCALVCLGGDIGCSITHFQRRHLDDAPS